MAESFVKFALYRRGEKGFIPGRDAVAEGIVFSSGKVALAWLTRDLGITIYDSLNNAVEATCQDGNTELVWADLDLTHS